MTTLRQYLQEQGRPNEAYTVLDTEIRLFTNEDQKRASIQSFLSFCSGSDVESNWNVEGSARLLLAQSLHNLGSDDLSFEQLDLSQMLYHQAPVPERVNCLGLQIRLSRLKFNRCHSREKLARWIEFLEDESVKMDYPTTHSAILDAADVAANILQSDRDAEIRRKFWNLQNRAESLLEERRDLCTLYIYHSSADDVARLYGEEGAILKWHDDFHARYPHFDLPRLLIGGIRKRLAAYQHLKDLENSFRLVKQLDDCVRQGQEFWREASQDRNETTALQGPELLELDDVHFSGVSSVRDTNQPDVGEHWHSEWSDDLKIYYDENWHLGLNDEDLKLPPDGSSPFVTMKLGTNTLRANSVYVTLLRWLKQAFGSKVLSREELEQVLLPIEDQASGEDVSALLERSSPENLFVRFSKMSTTSWEKPLAILSDWLLNRSTHVETKRQYLIGYLQHERATTVLTPDSSVIESQRMLQLIPQLNKMAAVSFKACEPMYRNSLARAKKMILCRTLQTLQDSGLYDEASLPFCEILDLYERSLQDCRAAGDMKMETSTLREIAQLYYLPASKLRPLAFQKFFAVFDAAETVSQKLREGWNILAGRTKVEKSLLAVEDASYNDLTPMGVHLLCLYPESLREQRDGYLWYLIQRMKSRGFAWLMQDHALRARGQGMEASKEMTLLAANQFNDQFNHWSQLKPIATHCGADVVFVDWYDTLGGHGLPLCPILITSHNGDTPKVWFTQMNWKEIEGVIDKLLRSDQTDLVQQDANKLLQQLQPLIEPLARASQPGQTLVFCSIGKMHQIPLHALELNGEVLIRRNPIVYCSSFATLKASFESRKLSELQPEGNNPERQVPQKPWIASLFGQPPSENGKEALKSLGQKFNVDPHTDDAFTPLNFTSAIQSGSNMIHFHSHGNFQGHDPLGHSLIFDDDEQVTMGDVYDLSSACSYHATLLACGSGMSKTSVSNDVVGLVPAFLYSGAASTVSALWSFSDEDAALFTRYFYEAFDVGGRVNLAEALRRAVLRIMEVDGALYHWAPFVLTGYWMFEVGKVGG